MAEKRIVWMPIPGKDEEFFRRLEGVKGEEEFYALLAEAHKKGWVEIFGSTDKDPKDLIVELGQKLKVALVSTRENGDAAK